MKVSISDINNFLRCRRKWNYESTNRQSLRTKRSPKPYLDIGSMVHHAIDEQAKGNDPLRAATDFYEQRLAEETAAYEEVVGTTPSHSELEKFHESMEMAYALVGQYFDNYGYENPLESSGLKLIATEVSFKIPLADGIDFIGTFDGVAVDIETESKVWLVENKTLAQKLNVSNLQFSNQLVGYSWAFQVLTGTPVEGVLYNGIYKKVIQPPRVLKSGALSVDKTQPTTLQEFLNAMDRGGHDVFDPKYQNYIEFLEEAGTSLFFVREPVHFSQTQLENWGKDMRVIAGEMATEPNLYPNFRREGCTDCWVKDLCEAQELGRDWQSIRDERYEVRGYGSSESVDRVTADMVSSLDDLISTLGATRE